VTLVRSSGRPISAVARELGCGQSSLSHWLARDRQSRAAADPEQFAAEQAESEEIKLLRRRVAELEVEREILKRSAAWWVRVDAVPVFIDAHGAEFNIVDLRTSVLIVVMPRRWQCLSHSYS